MNRSVKFLGTLAAVALLANGVVIARDGQRPRGTHSPRATQPADGTAERTTERHRTENGRTRNVESVRTKTDDGFTRSTTVTNAQGETATRDVTVTRDEGAGKITRDAHATTFDGRTTSTSDVKQRTEDGYSRDTTHTRTDGSTHSRSVDVTCDKDTGKCDKQVKVDQSP